MHIYHDCRTDNEKSRGSTTTRATATTGLVVGRATCVAPPQRSIRTTRVKSEMVGRRILRLFHHKPRFGRRRCHLPTQEKRQSYRALHCGNRNGHKMTTNSCLGNKTPNGPRLQRRDKALVFWNAQTDCPILQSLCRSYRPMDGDSVSCRIQRGHRFNTRDYAIPERADRNGTVEIQPNVVTRHQRSHPCL